MKMLNLLFSIYCLIIMDDVIWIGGLDTGNETAIKYYLMLVDD